MKTNLKHQSIELRRKGYSLKEIAILLSVAQGSVSTWVKDVILTADQKLRLKKKSHSPEVVERRRQSRLSNEARKRDDKIKEAAKSIGKIDLKSLKMLGLGLYWGEGAKTMKGMARVSNSDPMIIMMCMRFFREVCRVPEEKFRGHIHIHSPEMVNKAEKYWSEITRLPLAQFYKTYSIKSKSSKNIRNTLPYGTLDVGVNDTQLLLRILGWLEGFKSQLR